jgi:hypothetical protein
VIRHPKAPNPIKEEAVSELNLPRPRHAVVERTPDLDNLAWSTLVALGATGESPGTPLAIVTAALDLFRTRREEIGTVFVNPRFTVTAPPGLPRPKFLWSAHHARVSWLSQLTDILGSAGTRRAIKDADPITRQLAYTGVLFVDGYHIHPSLWPEFGNHGARASR